MASLIPRIVKKEIVDLWVTETWKIMLLSNAHAPNAATQHYISDVSANEITDVGGAYPAGGAAISGKSANLWALVQYFIDANDVLIGPNATLNFRYGVIYKDTGNPATSPLRAQIDFVSDQIVVNGSSTIQWSPRGIILVG